MITLCIRAHAPLALVAIALFASGCQKVPLLAPSGSTITLSSAATALPANGTTTIVAQVIEPSGTPPHAGTLVSFTTTLGTIQPSEVETDISGRATTTFNANGASGTATITAISGGVSAGTTGAVKIAVGAAAVSSIILSASPISLPSSGGASTISATVYDSGGNGVGGVPVTFTAAAGSVSPSVANTDTAGVARTVLTTSRTAEVTAAAGVSATSGTTTTAAPTAKITVAVNLTATITVGTPTPAIPSVGQTVSFPLTYGTTTGSSPITRVTMSWGDGASQTFTGQPAVVSHSYGAVGSYLVTFTGTDAAGDPSTTSTNINVFSGKPAVGITVSNDNPLIATSVTFTVSATLPGSPTGVALQSVRVTFGEGGSADLGGAGGTVSHTYLAVGSYTATATATATNGQVGTASVTLFVK